MGKKDYLHAAAIFAAMTAGFVVLRLLGGHPFRVGDFANGALCTVLGFFFGMFAAEAVLTISRRVFKKETTAAFSAGVWSTCIAACYLIVYFKVDWWG